MKDTALQENKRAQFAEEVANHLHQQAQAQPAVNYHVIHHGHPPPPPPPPAPVQRDPEREAALIRQEVQLNIAQGKLDQHLAATQRTVEQVILEAAAKVREAEENSKQEARIAWEAHLAAQTRAAKAEKLLEESKQKPEESKPKQSKKSQKPKEPESHAIYTPPQDKDKLPNKHPKAKDKLPNKHPKAPEPAPPQPARPSGKRASEIIEVPIEPPKKKAAKKNAANRKIGKASAQEIAIAAYRDATRGAEPQGKRRATAAADAAFQEFAAARSRAVLGGMDISDILAS